MLPAPLSDRLAQVAALDRVVLASDFDGTLAPFVLDPMTARPADGAMDVLRSATGLPGVTVALVSGRDVDTLRLLSEVGDDEPIVLIGSHGAQSSLEAIAPGALLDPTQRALLADLEAALGDVRRLHPLARIERKPAAVALHTRGLEEADASGALAAAEQVAAEHEGVHLLRGKSVAELGVIETSKGLALRRLAEAVEADATVYFGDDVTDERAFEALDAGRDLTVKVGEGETAAGHRVAEIAGVVEALRVFVASRA